MVRYGILRDHTSKKRKIESTPFVFNFQVEIPLKCKTNNLFNGNERASLKISKC